VVIVLLVFIKLLIKLTFLKYDVQYLDFTVHLKVFKKFSIKCAALCDHILSNYSSMLAGIPFKKYSFLLQPVQSFFIL
jgi:hypothetical protein